MVPVTSGMYRVGSPGGATFRWWDGGLAGILISATIKKRWDRLESSLEIGVLKAFGEEYSAPFALIGMLYRL